MRDVCTIGQIPFVESRDHVGLLKPSNDRITESDSSQLFAKKAASVLLCLGSHLVTRFRQFVEVRLTLNIVKFRQNLADCRLIW